MVQPLLSRPTIGFEIPLLYLFSFHLQRNLSYTCRVSILMVSKTNLIIYRKDSAMPNIWDLILKYYFQHHIPLLIVCLELCNFLLIMCFSLAAGSDGKQSACNAGDLGSIPGSERHPGEGNCCPLQYSCLENPMDRGIWWATVHRVSKNQTRLSDLHFHVVFQSIYLFWSQLFCC